MTKRKIGNGVKSAGAALLIMVMASGVVAGTYDDVPRMTIEHLGVSVPAPPGTDIEADDFFPTTRHLHLPEVSLSVGFFSQGLSDDVEETLEVLETRWQGMRDIQQMETEHGWVLSFIAGEGDHVSQSVISRVVVDDERVVGCDYMGAHDPDELDRVRDWCRHVTPL